MVKLVEFLEITEAQVARSEVLGPLGEAGWWNAKVKKGIKLDWGDESHSLKAARHPQAFGTQKNIDFGVKQHGSVEAMAYQEEGQHNTPLMLAAYAKGWVRWLTYPDQETGEGHFLASGLFQDVYDFLKSPTARGALRAYRAERIMLDVKVHDKWWPIDTNRLNDAMQKL